MSKLAKLLRTPYPTFYKRWKAVVIPSVIIFLILYILQPFGLAKFEGSKFCVVSGFALIVAVASGICVYLLPLLFPAYHKEQNWTIGKYLLNLLELFFLIALGIWFYQAWLFNVELNGRLFLLVLFWVMVLAPFPTIFFLMWNRNLMLTRNLREAVEMNTFLSEKVVSADSKVSSEEKNTTSETLSFPNGTKDVLEMEADDFFYAEADGNYVKVCFRSSEGGKETQKLLRITMKQAEHTVLALPYIIRCHRAFLVNIRRVVKVDGNSQGYRLQLKGCESEVPVSRAYAKEVKLLIENKVER